MGTQLAQGLEGGIDGQRKLRGQLGRYDRGDDQGALEKQLVLATTLLHAFIPGRK
jgi:hypothetical protein